MSPVLGRLPRAPRSHPVKPGVQAPGLEKGTTASGKPTGAPRATGPDEPRRSTRGHEARQRGTPPATTKVHGQVPSNNGRRVPQTRRARTTRNESRDKNRCLATPAAVRIDECAPGVYPAPTGYEQPPSGWTSARPAAYPAPAGYETAAVWMDECAPGRVCSPCRLRNSRRPDGRVRAQRVTSPCRLRTAAVPMDECAPRWYLAPAGYKQPTSGWTECAPRSDAPLTQHRTRNPQHNTRSEHTGEQEPSGPGHRSRNTTHRAGTPVNRSQVAQDTAHATQHTEPAHR